MKTMNKPIRHFHFTQSLEPLQGAGLGYSALGLHLGLIEAGHSSRFAATKGAGFEEHWPGVELYLRKGPEKAFYSLELKRAAQSLVEASEIVHGHGFYVGTNWFLGREARRQNKPLVYHVQGFLDPWILARSRGKKRLANYLFERANFRHASLWRACSKKEEQQIRDYGITAPVIVLPNGVALPPERSVGEIEELISEFPKRRNHRAIFLSRIHKKKGLDLLIQAWAELPKEVTSDWELLLFGPDEGGYATEVSEWIEESDLGDSVRLMGGVTGKSKEAAFRSADLFVLPSYSEGFPMAVLEAASYGLPVVQTNECNFPELSAAGGAWECPPKIADLKGIMREALACNESERIKRGEAGRRLVAENYEWTSIAKRLHEATLSLV